MTYQAKINLKIRIEQTGSVEITIVDEHENVREETFTDYDEAVAAIEFEEIANDVYF